MEDRKPTGQERYLTDLRNLIKGVGDSVIALRDEYKNREDAFVVLAYRHLEDFRMRLGKIMQQIQGSVSIFDKPE